MKVGDDPEQVYEPLPPRVTVVHEKVLLGLVALKVAAPNIVSVIVTVLVLVAVEKPADAGQVPVFSAVLKFPAKVLVVALFTKVPANVGAVPLQVAEPLVPAVTPLPQEKIPLTFAEVTVKVLIALPLVVSVTVNVLPLE